MRALLLGMPLLLGAPLPFRTASLGLCFLQASFCRL